MTEYVPPLKLCYTAVVLLAVLMAGCTDATPVPTAADIPDEPEVPPNTTTPLGDPINPDPPPRGPTPDPVPPPPDAYGPSLTHWILRVSGNDYCQDYVFGHFALGGFIAYHDGRNVTGYTWSLGGVSFNRRTSLVLHSYTGHTYEYILLMEFPPDVLSGQIESYSYQSSDASFSCSGTGGTFTRTPR